MKKKNIPMNGRNYNNEYEDNKNSLNNRGFDKAKATRQHYLDLAKEMLAQGDRIAAESCYQFADHYTRIINEASRKNIRQKQENIANNNKPQEDNVAVTEGASEAAIVVQECLEPAE